MQHFIARCLRFIIFSTILVNSLALLLFFSNIYKKIVAAKTVYNVIKRSKTESSSSIVVIGDSVAEQLFTNSGGDSINSLACSYSISAVGQYLLLKNYIKANPAIKQCAIVMTPFSFQNNLDLPWTYNYFLKPFNTSEYTYEFNEEVRERISKIPYHSISGFPIIKVTNWSPKLDHAVEDSTQFLSSVSISYLRKIDSLAKAEKFKIIIISPLISISKRQKVLGLKNNVPADLRQYFQNYFLKIKYIDSNEFLDQVHYINPSVHKLEVQKEIVFK